MDQMYRIRDVVNEWMRGSVGLYRELKAEIDTQIVQQADTGKPNRMLGTRVRAVSGLLKNSIELGRRLGE